jgi:predicted dinucleotide-binding enzyme
MKIAILGTGIVGKTLGTKLIELGHDVCMGSRSPDNDEAIAWAKDAGEHAGYGTFNDAANGAEVLFNCTSGTHSIEAIRSIAEENRDNKILIDVANELEVVDGQPRSLASANSSVGLNIQKAFPELKVVKSLNTMKCTIMVEPNLVPGDHLVFISGDDADAKNVVRTLLQEFGWKHDNIFDLGGIETAVGPEMMMAMWLATWQSGNVPDDASFNWAIAQ